MGWGMAEKARRQDGRATLRATVRSILQRSSFLSGCNKECEGTPQHNAHAQVVAKVARPQRASCDANYCVALPPGPLLSQTSQAWPGYRIPVQLESGMQTAGNSHSHKNNLNGTFPGLYPCTRMHFDDSRLRQQSPTCAYACGAPTAVAVSGTAMRAWGLFFNRYNARYSIGFGGLQREEGGKSSCVEAHAPALIITEPGGDLPFFDECGETLKEYRNHRLV